MPFATVIVTAAVLLVGTKSSAPCSEQNGAEPSSATPTADLLAGAAAAVVNRQAVEPVTANVPPPGGLIAPASTVTE